MSWSAVYVVIAFFAAYLVTGLFIFDDYGITWDEPAQRNDNGYVNYRYITEGDTEALLKGNEKYHGPVFEILLVWGEQALGLQDSRDIYLFRHLVTFLAFFTGSIFFFFLCLRVLGNSWLALLGVIMLVTSPRIFADSFYNSKDLSLLAAMIIAAYTQLIFLQKPGYGRAIVHSLTAGIAVDIRITAIVVPLLTIALYLLLPFLQRQKVRFSKSRYWVAFVLFLVAFCGFTILLWPVLWEGPLYHFVQAFQEMSTYHWDSAVMYMGEITYTSDLPWHYLPGWIGVTTPPVYLGLILLGILLFVWRFVKQPLHFLSNRFDIALAAAYFLTPVLAVILLSSIVYDGWRHLYFIYPFGVLIAIWGLRELFSNILHGKKLYVIRTAIWGLTVLQIAVAGFFIVYYHPHQQVYFSELTPRTDMVKTWELDYWGQSYREAVEYILYNDPRQEIAMSFDNYPGKIAKDILPVEERKRVKVVALDSADYFIVNFRNKWDYFPFPEYYSVKVRGMKVIVAYKMH